MKRITALAAHSSDLVSKSPQKTVVFLLMFFLIIRIGAAVFLGQRDFSRSDAIHYHSYALAVVEDSTWITDPDFEGHDREPGYPLFLAAVYTLFGTDNPTAVYILQAIISTLTCLFIFNLAHKIFPKGTAFFALLWSGIYIFYIHYTRLLLRETLVFFLIIFLFYQIYRFLIEDRKKAFWLTAPAYVFLVLTDARYLFYLPFLILLFVYYQPFWQGVKKIVIFFAILAVPLAAWTVRTCIAYDGFVFINTRTLDLRKGDNLENRFKAQHVRKAFRFEKITSCPQIEYLPPSRRYPSEEERLLIKLGLNPKKRIPAELKAIRRDAYPATTFWGRKWFFFKEFWRPVRLRGAYRPCPDCRFNAWSLRHNLLCIGFYGVLLPFMLIGVFKLARERNRALLFLLFPLIIQNLLHVLQWALTRYRNPVDAFIIILSGYGVYAVWEFCRGKDTQKVTNPL